MRGKSKYKKNTLLPDDRFQSVLITQFVNKMMQDGKKETAQNILYKALDIASKQKELDQMSIFTEAIKNVSPIIEVKSKRIGGATYQVPVEVRPARRLALAMRWLIESSQNRNSKSMAESLANNLLDALENTGAAIKKREDVHKMAEANKAFAHYARI